MHDHETSLLFNIFRAARLTLPVNGARRTDHRSRYRVPPRTAIALMSAARLYMTTNKPVSLSIDISFPYTVASLVAVVVKLHSCIRNAAEERRRR